MKQRAEAVYDSLWGLLEEEYRVHSVPDLFAPGSVCESHYEQMLAACDRLNQRFGTTREDPDLDIVINSLLAICREVGKEMYYCGAKME